MTTGNTSVVRRLQKGHWPKNQRIGSWDQQIPLAGTVPICFCFERKKCMPRSFAYCANFFYLTSSAKGTLCAGAEPLFVFLSKENQLLGLRATFCLIQRNHTRKTTLRPFDTITPNHDINCLAIYGNATLLTRKLHALPLFYLRVQKFTCVRMYK